MKNVAMRVNRMARSDVRTAVATAFDRFHAKPSALPAALAPQAVGARSIAAMRRFSMSACGRR
ncbi:hypothetical protein [Chenggangzhangella methanolivorans]|uniref:Uncharacterized protein n=1 Tax=Chenggangzhangella methanolivorans TaxID=1437009 RepID=A0A9E6UQ24_9HYPH|nr:hypothetical protein [Chenggangzhangella methanolivorans]QZO02089.1 hypothetical protein K6K41_12930 [Chenggangzhangella methanolivorans]